MNLFQEIEKALTEITDGWTPLEQAFAMASSIVALRPSISLEVGVYAGKGLVSMALAHKFIKHGIAIGVDPYSSSSSASGQINPKDKEWWENLDHERIYGIANQNIAQFGVEQYADLRRVRSDDFTSSQLIGVLRIDGNHGEQVLHDIAHFCPYIARGGFLFLDDKGWAGGFVDKGASNLEREGWRQLYQIGSTGVFQKE